MFSREVESVRCMESVTKELSRILRQTDYRRNGDFICNGKQSASVDLSLVH